MVHGHHGVRRCHHCGREVADTVHTRTAYRVGYYSLHTGDVEPVEMIRPDDPTEFMTVLRLVRSWEIFTCTRCYSDPAIRRDRDRLFRPECADATETTSAGDHEPGGV